MITTKRWAALLLKHPLALAATPLIAADSAARKWLHRPPPSLPGEDPELIWWEVRGNWVLEMLAQGEREACVSRFEGALARAQALPNDAYSASQRIANAIYLIRAHPPEDRAALGGRLQETLVSDAVYLRAHPEFQRAIERFNNHLLNNYRAAVLAAVHRSLLPALPDMTGFAGQIANRLERHRATLFSDDGVLLEGSVSYELLILKHLVDIACCAPVDGFGARVKGWLGGEAERVRRTYLKDGQWLLPQIGDCSPDWNPATMKLFLDGFVLGHDTPYRRAWREELLTLGF